MPDYSILKKRVEAWKADSTKLADRIFPDGSRNKYAVGAEGAYKAVLDEIEYLEAAQRENGEAR